MTVICHNDIWILWKCLTNPKQEKLTLHKHHPESVGMNDTNRYTTDAVSLINYNCISPQIIENPLSCFHFFLSLVYSFLISFPFSFLFHFSLKLHRLLNFRNLHSLFLYAYYFPFLCWGLILIFSHLAFWAGTKGGWRFKGIFCITQPFWFESTLP